MNIQFAIYILIFFTLISEAINFIVFNYKETFTTPKVMWVYSFIMKIIILCLSICIINLKK